MTDLKDIVTCAVNGLLSGIDSKEETIQSILAFIKCNYICNEDLESFKTQLYNTRDNGGNKIIVEGIKINDGWN